VAGAFRNVEEKFTAPSWKLSEAWVTGLVEPLEPRLSKRFLDHCDRIKEFLADPNATYPKY
jgi:hypothetical protein